MTKVLSDYTVRQVDEIIRQSKSIKIAAEAIGVTAQDLYNYRSKNAKEFKRLNAEREQGLIVEDLAPEAPKDEETVQSTKAIEEAQRIIDGFKVKLKDTREELEQLKDSNSTLQDLIDHYTADKVKYEKEIEELKALTVKLENAANYNKDQLKQVEAQKRETERKALNMKEMTEKKAEQAQQANVRIMKEQKKTIETAMKSIENLRAENEKAAEAERENVAAYEDTIRDLQQQLHDLNNERRSDDSAARLEMAEFTARLYFDKLKTMGAI